MKSLTVIFILLVVFSRGVSQENWNDFKEEKRGYYSSLESSGVENFSCLVSSSDYFFFISDKADSTYYFPLRVIWLKDGRTYTILQPLPPAMPDSLKGQLITQVEQLKKIFKGTLSDWQQLALFNPFEDIPESTIVSFGKDTLGISFSFTEDNENITVKKTFTRGGRLGRVRWITSDLEIRTYPYYREIESKWVCGGWKSQFYQNGEVTSGFEVALDLRRLDKVLLPIRFEIIAQSKSNRTQKSAMQLYLKDYVLNQKFEIINEPSKPTEATGGEQTPQHP
jgi:hypothetical protein